MKKLKINLILTSVLMFIQGLDSAHAKYVDPVFSGYWYTKANYAEDTDSCNVMHFNYENLLSGSAKEVAAKLIMPAPRNDCDWGEPILEREFDDEPSEFIFNFDDLWNKIKNDPTQPKTQAWTRFCKTKEGYHYGSATIEITSKYICPKGYQIGGDLFDESHYKGCTNSPTVCVSDIAGRDLNVPGIRSLGHIGLFMDGIPNKQAAVMEVLKKDPPRIPKDDIYLNDYLESFTGKDKNFWGARYSSNRIILSNHDGWQMMVNAEKQMNFPFEYTLGWNWHPGSYSNYLVFNPEQKNWSQQMATIGAKFRCDSFVYYAYQSIGKHIIPYYHFRIFPKDLFYAMDSCRNKVGKVCGNAAEKIEQPKSVTSIANLTTLVSSSNEPNIEELDRASYDYVNSHSISRQQKISGLWGLINENQNKQNLFEYLIDALSALKPVELLPDLEKLFVKIKNQDARRKLIGLIISTLTASNPEEKNSLIQHMDALIETQSFLRDQLLKTDDAELQEFILDRYLTIFPKEIASVDLSQLKQKNKLKLSGQALDRLNFQLALLHDKHLENSLSSLIDKNNNSGFAQSVCKIMRVYPKAALSQEDKTKVKNFLIQYENPNQKSKNLMNCDIKKTVEEI